MLGRVREGGGGSRVLGTEGGREWTVEEGEQCRRMEHKEGSKSGEPDLAKSLSTLSAQDNTPHVPQHNSAQ